MCAEGIKSAVFNLRALEKLTFLKYRPQILVEYKNISK